MRKIVFLSLAFLALIAFANNRNDREVVLHHGGGKGLNQVHVDPPQVTYDDELNQLTVYFGSTGNITLEYLDVCQPATIPSPSTASTATPIQETLRFPDNADN